MELATEDAANGLKLPTDVQTQRMYKQQESDVQTARIRKSTSLMNFGLTAFHTGNSIVYIMSIYLFGQSTGHTCPKVTYKKFY